MSRKTYTGEEAFALESTEDKMSLNIEMIVVLIRRIRLQLQWLCKLISNLRLRPDGYMPGDRSQRPLEQDARG